MSAGSAFRKLVTEAACKVLTIRDLEDLDNADLRAVSEAQIPVKSEDEAA